ncbi:MAG: hypothetical protein CBB92_04965 [Flammeovirgaceae bacterium TMED32]|nr:MAG: hypothetical protein CBB92_04965 [Flammeovirgaceae bacterium TMED32]|tara:strand:- start:12383 stop:12781 length:399 start_codon:yes stop_codon:yes gene_type:complete
MADKKEYFWYLGGSSASTKIALVEKATNAVTKNGWTSDYKSIQISGNNNVRIRGKFTDYDIDNDSLLSYTSIPPRYQKSIVDKVIAIGYRDPRNKDLQSAEYFEAIYEKQLKKAKTRVTNIHGTGRIVPQDF